MAVYISVSYRILYRTLQYSKFITRNILQFQLWAVAYKGEECMGPSAALTTIGSKRSKLLGTGEDGKHGCLRR